MNILDIEHLSSLIDNNKVLNSEKENINNLYTTRRKSLVVKPVNKYYTLEELRTLVLEMEIRQTLFKTDYGREEIKKTHTEFSY